MSNPIRDWLMPTKEGKLVRRPDRKCKWCFEDGMIVDAFITRIHKVPRVNVVRVCNNQNCSYRPEIWKWDYYDDMLELPLSEYVKIREWMKQNKKDTEQLNKIDELIETKKKRNAK